MTIFPASSRVGTPEFHSNIRSTPRVQCLKNRIQVPNPMLQNAMKKADMDMTHLREISFPDWLEKGLLQCAPLLFSKSYSSLEELCSEQATSLAKDICQLSDFYIQHPDKTTPWEKNWAQRAYLFYFFPLNFLRTQSVMQEAPKNFFHGMKYFLDYGAGMGNASLCCPEDSLAISLVEQSLVPRQFFEILFSAKNHPQSWNWIQEKGSSQHLSFAKDPSKTTQTVFAASYSLTELDQLPEWIYKFPKLILIEPSTQDDGRRLMQWRQQLIDKGYHIEAPCTHQGACPLLTQSPKDWCHDRILFQQPVWFQKIEQHLPMKNRSLTFSYLIASKITSKMEGMKQDTSAANVVAADSSMEKLARLVGDPMEEKGKTRQLVCMDERRLFLAWMHRKIQPPNYPRGIQVFLPTDLEIKSNELRINQDLQILMKK